MEEQRFEEFGLENVFADNYLGSPDVVAKVVQGYLDQLYELIKKTGAGTVPKDEFRADWMKWAQEFADIFLGRNPDYIVVRGWNSRFAMGIAIKQALGEEFWEKHRVEYNEDPGQALFGWMGSTFIDICNQALKDPDAAGKKFQEMKDQVIKFLLGLERHK